jgi:hypothetical protein
MPSPAAAPPARKLRRLTAVLAKPVAGSQPRQPHMRGLRLNGLVMERLLPEVFFDVAMVNAGSGAVKPSVAK